MERRFLGVLSMMLVLVLGAGLRAEEGADKKKDEAEGGKDRRPQPERMLKEWDKNADGKLTIDEVPADRKEFFERVRNRADTDGDQALSLEELKKAFANRPGAGNGEGEAEGRGPGPEGAGRPGRQGDGPIGFFRLLDANGDGKLTREELARAPDLISKLDRDGDGALSPRELLGSPPRPEDGRPEGRRPEGAPPAAERPIARMLSQMDKDGDGKISKTEAKGRLERRFAEIDANSDGYLDRAELGKMAERLRDQKGEGNNERKPPPEGEGKDGAER